MSAAEKYDSKYSMPRTQSEIMESRREASACLTNDDPPEEDNLMSGLVGLPGVFQLASEEEEGLLGLSAANPDEVDPRKTHSDRELRLSRMTCEIGEEELRDREEAFAAKVMEAAIAATTGDSDKASEWNEMHNPLRKSRLTVAETIVEESVMKFGAAVKAAALVASTGDSDVAADWASQHGEERSKRNAQRLTEMADREARTSLTVENISSPKLTNTPMNPNRRLHANNRWSTAKYDSDRLSRESYVEDEKVDPNTKILGRVADKLSSIASKSRTSESGDATALRARAKLRRGERVTHPTMEDEWVRKYSPARTEVEREESQREARDSLMDDDSAFTELNVLLDGLPDDLANMILVGDAPGPDGITRLQG
mmetsp:Transcript_100930/g.289730  ORF Transcript_100930/g.289730 Transcript_100930/m.289730 type:complete len:371 (+) Transcript_100930:318-1430(+)